MGRRLVRQLRDNLIERIRQPAAANGRSVKAERRAVLKEALGRPAEPLWITARRLREQSGHLDTDSAEIIHAARTARIEPAL